MKKLRLTLLVLFGLMMCLSGMAQTYKPYTETQTPDSYTASSYRSKIYKITNAKKLLWLKELIEGKRQDSSNDDWNREYGKVICFEIADDIDMQASGSISTLMNWEPINIPKGISVRWYVDSSRTRTIKNLCIHEENEADGVGIFSKLQDGNLRMYNLKDKYYYELPYDCHGLIVFSNAKVYAPNSKNVGILAGYVSRINGIGDHKTYTFIGLETSSNCIVLGGDYTGGLIGHTEGDVTILSSINRANVTGGNYTGGIAGYGDNSTVFHALYNRNQVYLENYGNITGHNYVGGIFGYHHIVEFTARLANYGNVNGWEYVGGFAGKYDVEEAPTMFFNAGNIAGKNHVTGACGNYAYNKGNVTCTEGNDALLCIGGEPSFSHYLAKLTIKGQVTEDIHTVSRDQLVSGEIAYKLNRQGYKFYGQRLGIDQEPEFSIWNPQNVVNANIVYYCSGQVKELEYTNATPTEYTLDHVYENGTCKICGDTKAGYEPIIEERHIYNYNEFVSFMNLARINNKLIGYLEADIDLTPYYTTHTTWEPVGTKERPFMGKLFGNGHKISNLCIKSNSSDYNGLFGWVDNATIENLELEDVNIDAPYSNDVGALCGYAHSKIINVSVTGNSYVKGGMHVGGIIGYSLLSLMEGCQNAASVYGYGAVGGICGYSAFGTERYCVNTGNVYLSDKSMGAKEPEKMSTGGIIGDAIDYLVPSTLSDFIEGCLNAGDVYGVNNVFGVANKTYFSNYYTSSLNIGHLYDNGMRKTNEFTELQILNGEAAWTLKNNKRNEDKVWIQQLGVDAYPRISKNAEEATLYNVCKVNTKDCQGNYVSTTYRNCAGKEATEIKHYMDERGICTKCSKNAEPQLVDGTYRISNLGELLWYNQLCYSLDNTAKAKEVPNAKLVSNIDMEGVKTWNSVSYYATFDGNNHTIRGYKRTSGFFSKLYGNVSNLTIIGEMDGSDSDTRGLIANALYGGSIVNCKTQGVVCAGSAGGIVGYVGSGLIKQCINQCSVRSTKGSAGGIAGENEGTITLCINQGDVNGYFASGGIVGYLSKSGQVSDVAVYPVSNTNINIGSTYTSSVNGGIVGKCNGVLSSAFIRDCGITGSPIVGSVSNTTAQIDHCIFAPTVTASKTNDYGTRMIMNQIMSGAATFELQNMRDEIFWSQSLGRTADNPVRDEYPVLNITGRDNSRVCAQYVQNCLGEISGRPSSFANDTDYTRITTLDHQFDNHGSGHCTVCGISFPPEQDEDGYYLIRYLNHLEWLRDAVNLSPMPATNIKAKLVESIDLSSVYGPGKKSWEPIGKTGKAFSGVLEGNGQLISGLYYDGLENTENGGGIFGNIENATIRNILGILGQSNTMSGGMLAYQAKDCVIENVRVGWNDDNTGEPFYKDDKNTAIITGEGGALGGMIGTASGCTFTRCVNCADVTSTSAAGGLVGVSQGGNTFDDCGNYAPIVGNSAVGGLIGYSQEKDEIRHCLNVGKVTAETEDYGMLVGLAQRDVTTYRNYGLSDIAGIEHGHEGLILATAEQMASGEIAYLINEGRKTSGGYDVWGQRIESVNPTRIPVLGVVGVYPQHYKNCMLEDAPEIYYSNAEAGSEIRHADGKNPVNTYCPDNEDTYQHVFADGKCQYCHKSLQEIVAPRGGHHLENGVCTYCHLALDVPEQDEDGYYLISNAGELVWLAQHVTYDKRNLARQTADIDLSAICHPADAEKGIEEVSWMPIGHYNGYYYGEYDGQGHSITGLYINNNVNDADHRFTGLFSALGYNGSYDMASVVKDLTVEGDVTGASNTGMIAGCVISGSRIEHCVARGRVRSVVATAVGGIVGYMRVGRVTDCMNEATVFCQAAASSGQSSTGGIAGVNNGSIMRCSNAGYVTAVGDAVGGIAGRGATPSQVIDGNTGKVYDTYDYAIANCSNQGTVYGNSNVGGIVGSSQAQALVHNNWNVGQVKANEGGVLAGVAGVVDDPTIVSNCYYDAEVSAVADAFATAVSTSDFAYGRVAYLLGDAGDGLSWGQDLEAGETLPVLGGRTIYRNIVRSYEDYSSQSEDECISEVPGVTYELPGAVNRGVFVSFDWQLASANDNFGAVTMFASGDELFNTSSPAISGAGCVYVEGTSTLVTRYEFPSTGDYTLNDNYCTLNNVTACRYVNTPYMLGDVDNSGTVTLDDVEALQNYLLGTNDAISNFEAADLNGDSEISIADLVLLVDFLSK